MTNSFGKFSSHNHLIFQQQILPFCRYDTIEGIDTQIWTVFRRDFEFTFRNMTEAFVTRERFEIQSRHMSCQGNRVGFHFSISVVAWKQRSEPFTKFW